MAGQGIIESLTDPEILVSAGVPAILGLTSGSIATADQFAALASATMQAAALATLQELYDNLTGQNWGIFKNSSSTSSTILSAAENALGIGSNGAIFPDAVVFEVGFNYSATIAQALVEGGSFMPYNKTLNPKQTQIGMSFSGTAKQKAAQLSTLESLWNSTTRVSVRMPSYSFDNMNVVNVSSNRTAQQGADLMVVTVTLQEARVQAQTVTVQTKGGTSVTEVDTGTKQTQIPTTAQSTAIESGGLY